MTFADRARTADDAPFVAALFHAPHARRFVVPASEDAIRAATAAPHREERIVLLDGAPAGFWAAVVHDDWLVEARILIAAVPRRGVGTYAIGRMIAHAFDERGAHRLYLEVTAGNAGARRLYERAGFVLEGTWRDGFRTADGAYEDLCAYGMLARDRR